MVHHSQCPVCSSSRLNNKFRCTDYLVSLKSFIIVECADCGFNFTQDHPGEEEAGSYYESEEYISHSDISDGLVNKLYRFARRLMLKRKARLIRKVTGFNAMKQEGWQAEGIEINEKARDFSKRQFGLVVHDPSQISKLVPGSYDCITLWHVLEHFHDPAGFKNEIAHLLKPEGSLIIALPNCSSYDAQYYKEKWAAWDVPRHLWHFTPESFRKFIEKKGFSIISTLTLPLDVFYISILSEKNGGSRLHFLKGMVKGMWFRLKSIFNKEKGSSLVYILKKKD
jgi:SAM-dependent methyltransferase